MMFIEKLIEMEIQQANKTHRKTKGSEKKHTYKASFHLKSLVFHNLKSFLK